MVQPMRERGFGRLALQTEVVKCEFYPTLKVFFLADCLRTRKSEPDGTKGVILGL